MMKHTLIMKKKLNILVIGSGAREHSICWSLSKSEKTKITMEDLKNGSKLFFDSNKKKEKFCSSKVKMLLFDKFLQKIYNEKHKIQTITSFFKKT